MTNQFTFNFLCLHLKKNIFYSCELMYTQTAYQYQYVYPQAPVFPTPIVPPPQPVNPVVLEPPKTLSLDLPKFEYTTDKIPFIPFDKHKNDYKFETPLDAMSFIAKHCLKYHQVFNRNLAKIYSKHVRVLSIQDLSYVQFSTIDKKIFNSVFTKIHRRNA